MTHPAQEWIDAATKKRKRGGGVEGRARGGRLDRPGKAKKRDDGGSVDPGSKEDFYLRAAPVFNQLPVIVKGEDGKTDWDETGRVNINNWADTERQKYQMPLARDVQRGGGPEIPDRSAYQTYGVKPERKSGGGINIKPSHKGKLHHDLGIPAGKPIPEAKMEKAKANASPAERKRITFAENAKKWHHGKG